MFHYFFLSIISNTTVSCVNLCQMESILYFCLSISPAVYFFNFEKGEKQHLNSLVSRIGMHMWQNLRNRSIDIHDNSVYSCTTYQWQAATVQDRLRASVDPPKTASTFDVSSASYTETVSYHPRYDSAASWFRSFSCSRWRWRRQAATVEMAIR